jgi:hypothetical protein
MLQRILRRIYETHRAFYRLDQRVLYNLLYMKGHTHEELQVGVLYEGFTIRYILDLHRFGPIDFTNLGDLEFDKLEQDMYYLTIEHADEFEWILAYYDAQLDYEDIQLVSYEDMMRKSENEYERSLL